MEDGKWLEPEAEDGSLECGGMTPLSLGETCLAVQSADMSPHSKEIVPAGWGKELYLFFTFALPANKNPRR
jgi:hypothetical protein